MDLKPSTVDPSRYLVDPKCKTVDHDSQLDFSKQTGRTEVELVDLYNI